MDSPRLILHDRPGLATPGTMLFSYDADAVPELAAMPWEAMYDPANDEFICRAANRLIRHIPSATPAPLAVTASLEVLDWMIEDIDLILLMSVNPGFGGQSFIPSALRKVEKLRRIIDASGRDIRLEVDGGIKTDNIRAVADAGADTFVAGSAIFGQPDYKAVIDAMRRQLAA